MQIIYKGFLVLCLLSLSACSQVAREEPREPRIEPEQAQHIIEKDSELVILDVRTPEEYAEGHLPGAILMNYYDADFKQRLEILDKNKHYLLYCRSGGRSGKATAMMQALGFDQLYDLKGGFTAWQKWRERLPE